MYLSMRLGSLVRLLAGIAAVSVIVFGVLATRTPAHSSPNTRPPASPASSALAADVGPSALHVVRTGGTGLNIRDCPKVTCARVGWVAEGGSFAATCAVPGSVVHGDKTWLKGAADDRDGYVARYYIAGPAGAGAADPVPVCGQLSLAKG
jgi:hypothetical protein